MAPLNSFNIDILFNPASYNIIRSYYNISYFY